MDLNRAAHFVRVVESGSFTAAASALDLPTSSISRAVKRLEGELGVTLLERTTRKLTLTDAGRAYFERARDAVAGLDEASALALDAAREPQGLVRVAAPPELGPRLAYLAGEIARRYPKIALDVTFTSRGDEIVGPQVDIAVVVANRLEDSSLIVRRLGATTDRIFASRAYLERRAAPRRVADLAQHTAVLFRGQTRWHLTGPRGVQTVRVAGSISGDHMAFVVEAVQLGLGVGLLPHFIAERSPDLVHLLPAWAAQGGIHSLVHPSRHLPQRVRLVRDLFAEHLTAACSKQACMAH